MMERRSIPFTGSGSAASAAALDKARTKEILGDRVRVAESRVAYDAAELAPSVREMLARHQKIVLKPLASGSSRGLFFLDRRADPNDVVAAIATLGVPYLIEQFISGRELSVAVTDRGDQPFALPVIEIQIDPGHDFDYASKYLGKGSREICPADIPHRMRDEAQQAALDAHIALRCEGYSRSDFVAAEDGIYFLELNTLPGLTTSSLMPQELRAAGIEFRDFLEEQIELARQRLTVNS
jgi:D-alanine-D-alanine ligase